MWIFAIWLLIWGAYSLLDLWGNAAFLVEQIESGTLKAVLGSIASERGANVLFFIALILFVLSLLFEVRKDGADKNSQVQDNSNAHSADQSNGTQNTVVDTEKIEELTEQVRRITNERDALNGEIETLKGQLETVSADKEKLYKALSQKDEQLAALQAKLQAELVQLKEPQVDIIYENKEPYLMEYPHGGATRREIYIGVRSRIAIKKLVVEISTISFMSNEHPPFYALREADGTESNTGIFSIEPEKEKLFHLASIIEPSLKTPDVRRQFTFLTVAEAPMSHNGFLIVARGNNIVPCEKRANLSLGGGLMHRSGFSFTLSDNCL